MGRNDSGLALNLGHVAIDGAKIKANAGVPSERFSSLGWNASKHKAMCHDRMGETGQRLKREIDAVLKQADKIGAAEDDVPVLKQARLEYARLK